MEVTLYGSSDDLIEVKGDVDKEFPLPSDDKALLAFSDGTVLRIEYTDSGVWRIKPVVRGAAHLNIEQAPEDDEDNYSDRATLVGEIQWVLMGRHLAKS